MITINGTTYNTDKIVITDLYEGERINLSSDSSVVTWTVKQFPKTQTEQNFNFNNSNDEVSTINPESFDLDLVGTYFVKVVERDANGMYAPTNIYIRSNSIVTHTGLPFSGETNEINSKGWAEELTEYIIQLSSKIEPLLITEFDGGGAIYSGNEVTLSGGDANSIFMRVLDCGTAGSSVPIMIDGGNSNS